MNVRFLNTGDVLSAKGVGCEAYRDWASGFNGQAKAVVGVCQAFGVNASGDWCSWAV